MKSEDEHIITRSPYKPVEIGRGGYDVPDMLEELPVPDKFSGDWWKLTAWERVTLFVDDAVFKLRLYVGLTPHLFQITKGLLMKSWKTTLAGVVGAIAYACNLIFGLEIPSDAILAVAIFAIGLFAKDGDVSGSNPQ